MVRRLKKLTTQTCLEAIAAWLRTELDIEAGTSRCIKIDGALWIEFTELRPFKFQGQADAIGPYIRGVLLDRAPTDIEAPFWQTVLVIDLLERDATPRVDRSKPGVISTDTPTPFRTIAVVATADGVDARDVTIVRHGLGEQRTWPFDD